MPAAARLRQIRAHDLARPIKLRALGHVGRLALPRMASRLSPPTYPHPPTPPATSVPASPRYKRGSGSEVVDGSRLGQQAVGLLESAGVRCSRADCARDVCAGEDEPVSALSLELRQPAPSRAALLQAEQWRSSGQPTATRGDTRSGSSYADLDERHRRQRRGPRCAAEGSAAGVRLDVLPKSRQGAPRGFGHGSPPWGGCHTACAPLPYAPQHCC